MKFVIRWSVANENYTGAMKKFLETGAPPPEGVKFLGRYHALSGSSSGFIVAESDEAKSIYEFLVDWMDLASFEVIPVVEDAEAALLLQGRK